MCKLDKQWISLQRCGYITQQGLTDFNTHTHTHTHTDMTSLSKSRCNQCRMGRVHMRIHEWSLSSAHTPAGPMAELQTPRWSPMLSPPERRLFLQLWLGGGGSRIPWLSLTSRSKNRGPASLQSVFLKGCIRAEGSRKTEVRGIRKGLEEERKRLCLFALCNRAPSRWCKPSLAAGTTARTSLSSLIVSHYATGSLSQVELIRPHETCSLTDFTIKQSRLGKSSGCWLISNLLPRTFSDLLPQPCTQTQSAHEIKYYVNLVRRNNVFVTVQLFL